MSVSSTEELNPDAVIPASESVGAEESTKITGADAESPPAAESVKETLVDRIKKSVDNLSKEKSLVSGGNEDDIPPKVGDDSVVAAEEDAAFTKADDLQNLKPGLQKRVKKLLAEVDKREDALKEVQPAVEGYNRLTGFLKDNGISMDDANSALDLVADLKRDPKRAYDRLLPVMLDLQRIVGITLPDDLKQEMDNGYISEERAREIARGRADIARRELSDQETAARTESQKVEDAQRQGKAVEQSVTSWETKWKNSDPDYPKLRNEVQDEIELGLMRAQREGKLPGSPEAAVKFAEACLKRVKEKIARLQPNKQEVVHVSGSSSGTNTVSRPKTLQEALLNAVNK